MVNVRTAEYVPVPYAGLSAKVKLVWTVFGSLVLHDPPPPVQTPAPTVNTLVCDVVESVREPEQAVPRVAALQV
ncbi:MAG TPA: hypothetical protein VLY04_19545 [Bryobacteraceae bacterium]|nr:hypothetical protein [Bryobacteraceae bacterium]